MTDSDDAQGHKEQPQPSAATTPGHSPTLVMMDSVIALGAEKLLGLAAVFLIFVGFFAPLATAQTGGFFSSGSSISYSLSQAGIPGLLTLAIGLALALLPFDKGRLSFANRDLIAYGVASGFFGVFAILWLVSLSLPAMIASFGGLSGGFYALMLGFALNVFATATRLRTAIHTARP